MDERALLEVLLPVLLRGRLATSDTVLDEDNEGGRFCLQKKSMGEAKTREKNELISFICKRGKMRKFMKKGNPRWLNHSWLAL